VEGADETAGQFAALLSISLQSIKQYHDEKFDKSNFIKNVVLDNILPGDIYAKARELHFATDVSRVVFIVRVTSGGDISAYDVVSSLFPDKQKDFVFNISDTDTCSGQGDPQGHRPHRYGKAGGQHRGYPVRRALHQGCRGHRHPHRQREGSGHFL